jgi:hypothetical protein
VAVATTEEVASQAAAYQRTVAAVRAAVLAVITRAWGSLEQYRDEDIDWWVATVTPVVGGGLGQVAALTDAYLATVIGMMADSPATPIGIRSISVRDLRGVPADEVYRRAGETVWSELNRGADLADAVAKGLERAQQMAATDLQLAKTHTARDVLVADKRVTGYRRVLNGTSCKLCAVAATRIYATDQLQPGHVRCDCGLAPVIGDRDPALAMNKRHLADLKASGASAELSLEQAAARARETLRIAEQSGDAAMVARSRAKVQHRQRQLEEFRGEHGTIRTVATHDHGELGPVLADSEHAFTTI